jgi:hypothetical protein
MNIEEITFDLVAALEAGNCPYMLVGAIAAIHYGVARSTFDVDAVVGFQSQTAAELARRMGASYQFESQQAFEVFTGKPIHVIHVKSAPFKIDLFPLTDDAFDQERFGRRRRVRLRGREVFLPTAEDVVVQKLRWGRGKDLDDARDVMAVQYQTLDWSHIEHWCKLHGTRELLQKIKSAIPPN